MNYTTKISAHPSRHGCSSDSSRLPTKDALAPRCVLTSRQLGKPLLHNHHLSCAPALGPVFMPLLQEGRNQGDLGTLLGSCLLCAWRTHGRTTEARTMHAQTNQQKQKLYKTTSNQQSETCMHTCIHAYMQIANKRKSTCCLPTAKMRGDAWTNKTTRTTKHTQTQRHTGEQTNKETNKETSKQTSKQTNQ